jgi:PAS domain-containing protein
MALDRDGTICDTTRAVRQLLEYGTDTDLDGSFFAHVHTKHRARIMHDLADLVCRGKQRAQWLLRMRTGHGRWRWYRASAHNRLTDKGDDCILIHLRPV